MASDDGSMLSELPSTISSNPFTLARAQSVASTQVPAKNTRNFATRAPVAPNPKKGPQPPPTPTPQEPSNEEEEQEEEIPEDVSDLLGLDLQTPGPGSSISQSSESSKNTKIRPKTSWIHEHARSIRLDGGYWQCNYCEKRYKTSGGSHAFIRHLKQLHRIDPMATNIAKKRDENGTNVHAAVLRQADVKQELITKEDYQKRKQLLALNKTTLKYLYIRWITIHNHAFNQVTHKEFRDFL